MSSRTDHWRRKLVEFEKNKERKLRVGYNPALFTNQVTFNSSDKTFLLKAFCYEPVYDSVETKKVAERFVRRHCKTEFENGLIYCPTDGCVYSPRPLLPADLTVPVEIDSVKRNLRFAFRGIYETDRETATLRSSLETLVSDCNGALSAAHALQIIKFNAKIVQNRWGLKLDSFGFVKIARNLTAVQVYIPDDDRVAVGIDVKRWKIVVTSDDLSIATKYVRRVRIVGDELGVRFDEPEYIEIVSLNGCVETFEKADWKDTQIVVAFVPVQIYAKAENYVRYVSSAKYGVPCHTVPSTDDFESFVQKTVLSVNIMLGGAPRTLPTFFSEHTNIAVCSVNIFTPSTSSSLETRQTCSVVFNLSNRTFRWSNHVALTNDTDSYIQTTLLEMVQKYHETNKVTMTQLVIYHCQENGTETENIYSAVLAIPVTVILVQPNPPTFFFRKTTEENLFAGTILTTKNDYNSSTFYLLTESTKSTDELIRPVLFTVILDTLNTAIEKLQDLTYQLCHVNFTVSGTANEPAPVSYARNLARTVGRNFGGRAPKALGEGVYFL